MSHEFVVNSDDNIAIFFDEDDSCFVETEYVSFNASHIFLMKDDENRPIAKLIFPKNIRRLLNSNTYILLVCCTGSYIKEEFFVSLVRKKL